VNQRKLAIALRYFQDPAIDAVVAGFKRHKNRKELSMMKHNATHLFHFSFEKTAAEVVVAASAKVKQIEEKISEREERIAKIRAEYKIDDKALIDILEKMRKNAGTSAITYSVSNMAGPDDGEQQEVTIGAGLVQLLMTERDLINSETDQVTRLGLLIRNLKDGRDEFGNPSGVRLSYEELEFLGF
jgi:hypothetical protein